MKINLVLSILAVTTIISCGPSQEEIQNKKTQDSLDVVAKEQALKIRQDAITDSVNKVNGARIADSLTLELENAMKGH